MAAPRPLFNLRSFLEKDKLKTDGSNFTNWFRTLRILLVPLKMAYVLEGALGDALFARFKLHQLIEVLLSSHLTFRKKFLLKKLDALSHKTLFVFSVMEEYPTVTLG